MKILATVAAVIALCVTSASALIVPTPSEVVSPNLTTQAAYFVSSETISYRAGWTAEYDRVITEDGNVWKADIDLPDGECIVIRNTHGDKIVENDFIVAIYPLEMK